jgi:hypothetical protein
MLLHYLWQQDVLLNRKDQVLGWKKHQRQPRCSSSLGNSEGCQLLSIATRLTINAAHHFQKLQKLHCAWHNKYPVERGGGRSSWNMITYGPSLLICAWRNSEYWLSTSPPSTQQSRLSSIWLPSVQVHTMIRCKASTMHPMTQSGKLSIIMNCRNAVLSQASLFKHLQQWQKCISWDGVLHRNKYPT